MKSLYGPDGLDEAGWERAMSEPPKLNAKLFDAAERITAEHLTRLRAAERKAHNAAVDRCIEIVAEWMAESRDEFVLFDKLSDAKAWTDESR